MVRAKEKAPEAPAAEIHRLPSLRLALTVGSEWLLPCNVTIESTGETRILVRLTDPEALAEQHRARRALALTTVASDAGDLMSRVAETLDARKRSK